MTFLKRQFLIALPVLLVLGIVGLFKSYLPGITTLSSVDSNGIQGNENSLAAELALSGNGRFIAFESEASNLVPFDFNNAPDLFVHDRILGVTEILPQGNDTYDQWMTISYDGRFVAFRSRASNLVDGDTNEVMDVFVFDRQNGQTERVSVNSNGEQANGKNIVTGISADGRYVSFITHANNLLPRVNSYLLDSGEKLSEPL